MGYFMVAMLNSYYVKAAMLNFLLVYWNINHRNTCEADPAPGDKSDYSLSLLHFVNRQQRVSYSTQLDPSSC